MKPHPYLHSKYVDEENSDGETSNQRLEVGGVEAGGWGWEWAEWPKAGPEAHSTLSAADLLEKLHGRTATAQGKVSWVASGQMGRS